MAAASWCGLSIALFYDIYWLLFAWRPRPRWLSAIQDLLLALAVFCLVSALWLRLTGGVMRLAVYLWMMMGVLLFRATLSRPLRRLRRLPKLLSASRRPLPLEADDGPGPPSRARRFLSIPAALMLRLGRIFWRAAKSLAAIRQKNKNL